MGDDLVIGLLEGLSSDRAGPAWKEFLGLYSPLIIHVIRGHESEGEGVAECFAHVCAGLSDDGFRRLRSFRPDGPARFRTWLTAVVSNLCLDWIRKRRGRIRPVAAVSRLPELDQQVYRCIFVNGMSRAECLETLQPRFGDLTEPGVARISARLFAVLAPQQRWQLATRSRLLHRREGSAGDGDTADEEASPDPEPDELVAEWQDRLRVQDALGKLPPDQRLLLRLRYEQDLTLAEVARLTRQPDLFRANRQIHAALEALAGLMGVSLSGARKRKSR